MILSIVDISHVFNLYLSAILCTVICSQGYFHKLFSMTFGFSSRKRFFPPRDTKKGLELQTSFKGCCCQPFKISLVSQVP